MRISFFFLSFCVIKCRGEKDDNVITRAGFIRRKTFEGFFCANFSVSLFFLLLLLQLVLQRKNPERESVPQLNYLTWFCQKRERKREGVKPCFFSFHVTENGDKKRNLEYEWRERDTLSFIKKYPGKEKALRRPCAVVFQMLVIQ